MKRVLMVAYHFPPMSVSSGIQRTLRFAQYLPDYGWRASVLTTHPRVYPATSQASLAEVPSDLEVCRAFALDASQHLSIRGRYSRWLAKPDRWSTWWLGAVPAGLGLIRRLKPDVIWSTYPIATAQMIGYTLHRLTGIPWVAEFRDPMAEPDEPDKASDNPMFEKIERLTLEHCARAVFTAPGALKLYAERYPEIPCERLAVIENGYDESAFSAATHGTRTDAERARPLLIVHSGTLYPSARDPRPFFSALSELKKSGRVTAKEVQVLLRATGFDDLMRKLIREHGIDDLVTLAPAVPYRAALAEMLDADGLLLLQAGNCNYQLPAKLYEYFRARRPILALTDPRGDTAGVLRTAGVDTIAPLDCKPAIADVLLRFIDGIRAGTAPRADEASVAAASRKLRTAELARLLEHVVRRA